ncbi:DUF3375 family protein [Neptuniibacter marinus]|uniref:DUF3375 family protein n=1 Tax=Neptuniibacter marinus TaxID=1806670 RepID=UPI003B5B4DD5
MKYKQAHIAFSEAMNAPTMKMLIAKHSAFVLAFLSDVFSEQSEIEFNDFLLHLSAVLEDQRVNELNGPHEDTNARYHYDRWIRNNWIREMDGKVIKTEAFEQASRFAMSLENRTSGVTSNHLQLVHNTIKDYSSKLNSTPEERIKYLESQISDLKKEVSALRRGEFVPMSDLERREGIQEIYQQAELLTKDFRYLEDETIRVDRKMRQKIATSDSSRASVLETVLNLEDEIFSTEAGSSFTEFDALLRDTQRQEEINTLLISILAEPESAQHLNTDQKRYLSRFVRELNKESGRIRDVRKKTSERLRDHITSYQDIDLGAIGKVLSQIEHSAISIHNHIGNEVSKTYRAIPVTSACLKVKTRNPIRLHTLKTPISAEVESHDTSSELSDVALEAMNTLQARRVAERVRELLRQTGRSMTLGEITEAQPLTSGVEELIALIRVAKASSALESEARERVTFTEDGKTKTADIPFLSLHASGFPNHIEDMNL